MIQDLSVEEVRGLVAWHTNQHHINTTAGHFELAEWNKSRAIYLIELLNKDLRDQ